MRTKQSNIYSYKVKSTMYNFFVKYYKIILLLALISLLAILTAIFTASKYLSDLELGNMLNETFVNFIKRKSSVWSLFFKLFFNYLILCMIAIFLNIKPFCIFFNIVAIVIYCYYTVFDITLFILLFGISGIIYGVLILIPFFLILLGVYIIISSIAIKTNILKKKFGKICAYDMCTIKLYAILIFIAMIALIIECNLLSIIHYTIIVN